MTAFAPETASAGQELAPGQSFDLNFTVAHAGTVTVVAIARRALIEGGRLRIDLFAAGQKSPVATRQAAGRALMTVLTTQAAAGDFVARITNTGTKALKTTVHASFPGSAEIVERSIPLLLIETIVNNLLARTKVTLQAGELASSVDFPDLPGLADIRFTVPDYERTIRIPVLPDIHLTEAVNQIQTSSMSFRVDGTTLALSADFEQQGVELTGSFEINLTGMKLEMELDLAVAGGKLTYDGVRARFDGEANLVGLPDWLLNPIFHYRERIREAVGTGVRDAFEADATRTAITNGLDKALDGVLGAGTQIASVRVENGQLVLGTFRATRRAAA